MKLSKIDKFFWLVPLFVIFIYNFIFLYRFYPITEGWFSVYAWMINNGQFPYRDFYFFLTPLYLIKMSIFTSIFGYSVLSLRIFGLGVILLMTYFLFKNFEIIFGAGIASFVTIVGIIFYQSGNAHITYDFIQFLTLYSLIQSYFLLKYINVSNANNKIGVRWIFLAGLFAGLAFLTKQSNGAMITAFSFAGLFILSLSKGKSEVIKTSSLYIAGFMVPVVVIILWLILNSAFLQFIDQVFLGAASAKGGVSQIFLFWIKGMLTYNFVIRFAEISLIVLFFGYWLYFFRTEKKDNKDMNKILMLFSSLFMILVVLLPLRISKETVNELSMLGQLGLLGQQGITNVIVAGAAVPIVSILIASVLFILKKNINKNILLLSFVALGFVYGTGTSAGVSEAGAFVGFCLFIALLLYYRSVRGLGKVFIVLFCISFSLMWVEVKYGYGYYWWNITSPDMRGDLRSTNKIKFLEGLYSSSENINLIEEVTSEISSGSKPNEPVFTFPNIPVFYLFADRKPPGKTIVHWFDFLPDKQALEEEKLIKTNPPKVIVYLDLGPSVWKAHEQLFRNGKPSGQRKIVKTFMGIIKSEKMHISKKYKLANDVTLTVWRH